MQTTIRFRWWAAVLLLSSCRSEQAAFSFRPAPVATSSPVSRPAPVAPNSPAPTVLPVALAPAALPVAARPVSGPVSGQPLRPRLAAALRQQAAPRRRTETTAVARTQAPRRHDALHVVLGALLVVGGVVAGLALGGWLGLGVGAVVVLLGYYFVVLGIGGKHAWLEIFQEFFNM